MPFIEGPNHSRQLPFKSCQQCLLTAVTDSNPKQFSRVPRTIGEMEKILILGDKNFSSTHNTVPDFAVRGFVHPEIDDMLGLMTVRNQKAAKSVGKLVVHQEIHAALSTT